MTITIARPEGYEPIVLRIEYYTEMGGPDGTHADWGEGWVETTIGGQAVRERGGWPAPDAVGRFVALALAAERY